MVARLEQAGRLATGQAGADRHAGTEPLGQRHDIRLDAGVLVAEPLAGARHAALHLVQISSQPCSSHIWRKPFWNST